MGFPKKDAQRMNAAGVMQVLMHRMPSVQSFSDFLALITGTICRVVEVSCSSLVPLLILPSQSETVTASVLQATFES